SGALPVKLTTPLMVAVPILPSLPPPAAPVAVAVGAALGLGAAAVAVPGFSLAVGFGSSGQPPRTSATVATAPDEARSRGCITLSLRCAPPAAARRGEA